MNGASQSASICRLAMQAADVAAAEEAREAEQLAQALPSVPAKLPQPQRVAANARQEPIENAEEPLPA